MKTILLAGGLGTRLAEETATVPKPMVEIGGRPILWHIMNIYAAQGFSEFVVALGYKGEVVKDYFLNFHTRSADLTIRLGKDEKKVHASPQPDWTVHLVDTGAATQTGGRLRRLASLARWGRHLHDDVRRRCRGHRREEARSRFTAPTGARRPSRPCGLRRASEA